MKERLPMSVENSATIFKSSDIKVKLGDVEYRLVYDMNSFIELEKIYPTVDIVIQLVLGKSNDSAPPVVTYNGGDVLADEISVDGVPLSEVLKKQRDIQATQKDTLNILFAGLLHDTAIYNSFDEITGYTVSKTKIASQITFKNLREINTQIVLALLQDLVPAEGETKNAEAPKTILHTTKA